MKNKFVVSTFLIFFVITLLCFTKSDLKIIVNKNQYEKFIEIFNSGNIISAFMRIPGANSILPANQNAIKTTLKLSKDKKNILVRIYKSDANKKAEGKKSKQKTLYKKSLGIKNAKISSFIFDISGGYIHVLICSSDKKLYYYKLAKSNALIISKFKADLNIYVNIKNHKSKVVLYDPLKETDKHSIEIVNFAIRNNSLLILTNEKLLYVINLVKKKIAWVMDQTNPGCSLNVFEDKFYYVHSNHLNCRNIETGEIIFSKKLMVKHKNLNRFVFGYFKKANGVLIGLASKAGFSVYNSLTGDLIYTAPYNYIAAQAESINKNNVPAGSAIDYKYNNGVVYILWYDQWKPEISRAWLSAFNVKNAEIFWNIPLRYDNGEKPLLAKKLEVSDGRIQLFSPNRTLILVPGQTENNNNENQSGSNKNNGKAGDKPKMQDKNKEGR